MWERFGEESGFTFSTVHEVAVDPNDERRVWAAPWGGGLFESTDGGDSWREREAPTRSIVTLLPSGDVLLAADRTRPIVWESAGLAGGGARLGLASGSCSRAPL